MWMFKISGVPASEGNPGNRMRVAEPFLAKENYFLEEQLLRFPSLMMSTVGQGS
ncbi:hypothetical protein ACQKL0_13035 [Peribacillus sp. NPDC097264]|uniref:hypothetical protein n=1 Tax=unclassified Peribacillus TaxID=2675266 RepID=UPI0037FC9CA8